LRKKPFHISVTPTGEQDSTNGGHVIFLRNVTSYKELDFAKTNFIATVSHEFKTPISSIKMSLQLLENDQIGTLNEEQKNLVDSIKDDAGPIAQNNRRVVEYDSSRKRQYSTFDITLRP
jgi:NtrC-family two-component system sensor histidine kinase KinB